MKQLRLGIWIVVAWLLQVTLLPYVSIYGIVPGILFTVSVCCTVLEEHRSYYIGIPIICGLIVDIFSSHAFCSATLIYFYISMLIVVLGTVIEKKRFLFCIFAVLIGSLLCESALYLFYMQTLGTTYQTAFFSIILKTAFYNMVLSFLVYPLLKKTVYTTRKKHKKRRRMR